MQRKHFRLKKCADNSNPIALHNGIAIKPKHTKQYVRPYREPLNKSKQQHEKRNGEVRKTTKRTFIRDRIFYSKWDVAQTRMAIERQKNECKLENQQATTSMTPKRKKRN